MNPGALGRQDHAHTCVLFENKITWQKTFSKQVYNINIFQLIEFLSCFSTMMSTLHEGSLVRRELAKHWTI